MTSEVASAKLTERETHFDFGKNWARYSELIDCDRLAAATESVRRLVPDVAGKTFLDIGSGSGLFSLAALHLGAARVHAVDIDEDSVTTTRKVLASFGDDSRWTAEQRSVFDLSPDELDTFDVVYSWGVLHHTGDMWKAIDRASKMVAAGGTFALALYEKTPLCGAWRVEKKAYMRAGPRVQRLARGLYIGLYRLGRLATGRNPFVRGVLNRGMALEHDVHDWLGGYPYESTDKAEVAEFLCTRGFEPVLEKAVKIHAGGIMGSGCSEYVYRRAAAPDKKTKSRR
jgi:2-polyprenyl-6-hydroxyphenyl methylase/3-demethylubiquinone-9 3-methyltransferase